jgi:hypothetical protein
MAERPLPSKRINGIAAPQSSRHVYATLRHLPAFFDAVALFERLLAFRHKLLGETAGEINRETTPYDKLKSLPLAAQFLKPGITFQQLDTQATDISDNEAVLRLNNARAIMFKTIFNRSKTAA